MNNGGKYVIFAEFNGDDEYKPKRSKSTFITSVPPHLTLNVETINVLNYNESNTISGTVKYNNTGVTGYNVLIKIVKPDDTVTTLETVTGAGGAFSTTYTPTSRGVFSIYAETVATNEYSRSISLEQVVYTNSLDTSISLSAVDETTIVGNNIALTATVTEGNNKLNNIGVEFYEGTTLIGTLYTNTKGECTLNTVLNTVGSHTYTAKVVANVLYNTSSSNTVSVEGIKHTVNLRLSSETIYEGWIPTIIVVDENNNNISGLTFTVTINNDTMTLTSDSGGLITLPRLNTSGTVNINVSMTGQTNYNNVDTDLTLTVKESVTVINNNLNAVNVSTKLPYRTWSSLDNMKVAGDGNYTACGTNCYSNTLAGRNGSRHTPAPLEFTNLGFNIPDGSVIESVKVNIRIRTLSCSSDSANIGISAPTLKMFNQSVLMSLPTSNGRLPYKNFDTITGEVSLGNVTVSQLNNNNTGFTVVFPKNSTTNTGKLQIDYVEVKIRYTPPQE